jgi:PTS system ascorbate-specific IIC component
MSLYSDLINNIFKQSFLIISIYIALGCGLQRKSFQSGVSSVIKGAVAVTLMGIGGEVISEALMSLTYLFQRSFQLIGIVASNERLAAYTEIKLGSLLYSIMIVGMLVNILIAKTSRYKYIFLTGHQIIYMSSVLAIILTYLDFTAFWAITFGGVVLGLLMSMLPALIQPYTREIIGRNDVAVGHFSSLGFYMSVKIGQAFESFKSKKEDAKKPNNSGLFADNMLLTTLSMIGIFVLCSFLAGKAYTEDITLNTHYIVFALKQGLIFSAGVFIVLSGVRMLVQEIMTSFKGIADKFVPDAIPALDCSILFPHRQRAMMIGFLFSLLGGYLAMFLVGGYSLYVVIPSSALCFFSGSAAGIYGNHKGGKLGGIVAATVFGIAIGLLPLVLQPEMRSLGFYKVGMGEFDFTVVAYIIKILFEQGIAVFF